MSEQSSGAEGERSAVLTVQEAAGYLRVSRSWVEHSDIPRVRLGRRVLFLRSDLDAYLSARRTHAA